MGRLKTNLDNSIHVTQNYENESGFQTMGKRI